MIHEEEEADDLLLRATRAMREELPAPPADPMVTLRRIQWSVAKEKRRSFRTRAFLLPIAATLATSTAFAAASGKLTPIFHAVVEVLHPAPAAPAPEHAPHGNPRPAKVAAPAAERAPAPEDAPGLPVATEAPAPADAPKLQPQTAPAVNPPPVPAHMTDKVDPAPQARLATAPSRPTAGHRASASTASSGGAIAASQSAASQSAAAAALPMPPAVSTLPEPAAPRANPAAKVNPMAEPASAPNANAAVPAGNAAPDLPPDPADALYRRAHALHFGPASPASLAATLSSWDAYLNASPNGRFAPEARFNRAIVLIKLGRRAEAATALAPFADGTYGSYRRDEARALLEAIHARR
ncbi:tol-pal system YbgF family protein [Pendulispora albinea]|uniref:Uncharacterized protein n=1 Tax=Pendulispora albinea TaxID=2741071 RepID=A0ABZ2LU90_9BACT